MRTWERKAASVAWGVAAYVKRFGTAGLAGAPIALWQPPQSKKNVDGNIGAVPPSGTQPGDVVPGGPLSEPGMPGLPELDAAGPDAAPLDPLPQAAASAVVRSTRIAQRVAPLL
jgi:hypothetical protein